MKRLLRSCGPLLVILAVLAAAPTSAFGQSDGWDWSVTIYGWVPDLNLNGSDRSETISRGDLVSKLEFVAAGHFEGRRNKAGFFLDAMYIDLATGDTLDRPNLPEGTTIDLDIEQLFFEIGGFYRPSGASDGFDVLFGARLVDLSEKVTIDNPSAPPCVTVLCLSLFPIEQSSSNSLWDGFVGLRYSSTFSDRWGWSLRGDVATGGTDLTLNGLGAIDWLWGADRQHGILFGWRYLDVDLKGDADALVRNVVYTGPFIAAKFGF